MYQFSKSAVTKYHSLESLKQHSLFSHIFGDQKSKIKIVFLRPVRENLFHSSVLASGMVNNPSRYITSIFTWHSPCGSVSSQGLLISTAVILDQWPTLLQNDLILTKYMYINFISKKGHILREGNSTHNRERPLLANRIFEKQCKCLKLFRKFQ